MFQADEFLVAKMDGSGMSVILRIEGLATGGPNQWQGHYVESCDFEADMSPGSNAAMGSFTADPLKAKQFGGPIEALEFWKTIRKRDGLRPDGKPNRPLTAFTVSIIQLGDVI